MAASFRPKRTLHYRTLVWVLLWLGAAAATVSFFSGRAAEQARAETEFGHRANLRHGLAREILGRFEDLVHGLGAMFEASDDVTAAEFARATARMAGKVAGAQALEWVPRIAGPERAAFEAAQPAAPDGRRFEIFELYEAGRRRPAAPRPEHLPIQLVEPRRGNEAAWGYDLAAGPTQAFLRRARERRELTVTSQIKLVQEDRAQFGLVMIVPVFRTGADDRETFAGYVQGVFRVPDLLETIYSRQPTDAFDLLFLDASETDPARRRLHARAGAGSGEDLNEAEFRRGLHREYPLAFGGRDWRMLVRPRAAWLAAHRTSMPYLRSASFLLLAVVLAAYVHSLGRRADLIRVEVEQRTAELNESRRHFSALLQALPGMAYRCTYDDELTVLFVSDGAQPLTGWTPEEFTGGAVHFRDLVHPDDLGRVREATRVALQERGAVEVEYRLRTREGREKWVLSRGRGAYAEDGSLRFFEGLAIDISAQKQAEAARLGLERKLLEGQKLESLGLLAGGIAHDFNNLLSSIVGNADLARIALPAGSGAAPSLQAIEAAALRAAELCRQMLAYAGKGRFVIEPTDLTALAEDLLPLLKVSAVHQANLKLELARGLPAVSADATQLRQIVMNLVLNAADAVGEKGGEITLATGVMRADAEWLAAAAAGAGLPAGEYVYLEVRDTGCGMAPEVLARIFDPFFTTKFAGRGLGLAAVLGIVRGHHGALRVSSAPGAGSVFRLLLPPLPVLASAPAPSREADRWLGEGKVLVIDDEDPVRHVLGEMLRSHGFEPLAAADGPTGIALLRADTAAVTFVALDLLMPGMNGEQTLAELRRIRPDLRVLLVSGYNEGDVLGRLAAPEGRLAFLAKPFTRHTLGRKLRELLA